MAKQFSWEIMEFIGNISEPDTNWIKQLNVVSWNGAEPKYDIRPWNDDKSKMGKGISLTKDELKKLYELLSKVLADED